jgi:PAS domain S-box-containing protein
MDSRVEDVKSQRSVASEKHSDGHSATPNMLPNGEERYRLLFEAGQQLSSTLDSSKVCERLRSLVSRAMPCDGIVISSYDPSEELIRCEYAYSGGQLLDASKLPPLPLGPSGSGMQSEVIRSGKPMLFGDVARRVKDPKGKFMNVAPDGSVSDITESEPTPTNCAIMVPILLDGKTTGVVQVMTDQPGAYSDEHLELLEGLVLLLGAAIQNSKLFAKVNLELAERLKAEQALRESEAKYRFIAEEGPGYTWTAGPNFELEYANHRWLELVGKTLDDLKGQGWQEVVHPEDIDVLGNACKSAAESISELSVRHRIRMADGRYRWVHSRAQPDLDSAGELREWFGLTVDIADQKRAEADLEQRVKQRTLELEAANREMEGFTFSVSHDLRGPLRAIMSTSMILKEDYGDKLPDDAKDQLERQARAARKMGDLIDDLLKLSRLGRQEISRKDLDLSALAAELVDELRAPAEILIQPGLHALADAKLMKLALQNLLDNAIKFSSNTGKAAIEFGQREDGAFFVRDNGIGFDTQYSDRLFLPFERLVLDRDYPGTGIGLANVKRIIDRHGGRVWAESELGHGATFYFTIP